MQADPLDESENPNHVMMIRKSNTTGNYSIINWPVPDQLLSKPGELVLEYDAFFPADSELTYLASSYYTNRGLNHSAQNFFVSNGGMVKRRVKKSQVHQYPHRHQGRSRRGRRCLDRRRGSAYTDHFIDGLEFAGAHGMSGDGMGPQITNGRAAAKAVKEDMEKKKEAKK